METNRINLITIRLLVDKFWNVGCAIVLIISTAQRITITPLKNNLHILLFQL